MTRRMLMLTAAVGALWLLLGLPARQLWGDVQMAYAGVAALLCLVPALATMAWTAVAIRKANAGDQLVAVLGGTGIRLFVVALAALGLRSSVPYFDEQPGFLLWLIVFYLFTLAVEMTLLLAGRPDRPRETINQHEGASH